MCFSVQASFAVALLLSVLAVIALRRVRAHRYYPFASIPGLFALQQYAEGVIWLNHDYGSAYELVKPAAYTFLGIAFGVWPVLMPFALYLIEKDVRRRVVLSVLLLWGIACAAYSLWALTTYGAQAVVKEHHIYYDFVAPQASNFNMFLYWMPVVGSFFVSSRKFMPLFGALVSLALAASYYIWYTYLTSVWCFFAAIISACIIALI